jgi:cob(I)alamin adenosyltransferase
VTDQDAGTAFESAVATRRGDDGTTGLLFGGERIRKDDLRAEAYGTIDEAVAALGIARAQLGVKDRLGTLNVGFGELPEILLRLQRELFVAAAELATRPDAWDRQQTEYHASVPRWSRASSRCSTRPRPTSRCRPSSSSRANADERGHRAGRTIVRRAERGR